MKKIILSLLSAVVICSCTVDRPRPGTHRTSWNLFQFASDLCSVAGYDAVLAFEMALKVESFLQEDEEGKKQAFYSDINYNFTSETYIVGSYVYVIPDGQSLLEDGASWIVYIQPDSDILYSFSYLLERSGNVWHLTNLFPNENVYPLFGFYNMSLLEFDTEIAEAGDGKDYSRTVSFKGRYMEQKDGFNATFQTDAPAPIRWNEVKPVSELKYAYNRYLVVEGSATVLLFKNSEQTDWCKIKTARDGTETYTTSVDIQ